MQQGPLLSLQASQRRAALVRPRGTRPRASPRTPQGRTVRRRPSIAPLSCAATAPSIGSGQRPRRYWTIAEAHCDRSSAPCARSSRLSPPSRLPRPRRYEDGAHEDCDGRHEDGEHERGQSDGPSSIGERGLERMVGRQQRLGRQGDRGGFSTDHEQRPAAVVGHQRCR